MSTRAIVVLVAAVLTAALTARLGVWQLDRARQKTELQEALERQRARPPLAAAELPADAAAAARELHRAVVLQGRWRADAAVYLDNRQMNGHPGFFVLMPLALEGDAGGRMVLVQRGWVPRDIADRTRVVAPPPPTGTVRVLGRIAERPARLFDFAPGAVASGPIRQNLDPADFARETRLPLAPLIVVQEGGEPIDDGLLRQWPAPASDVHKHLGYAFQWFALSALVIGLYVWFQLVRPRLARRAGRDIRGDARSQPARDDGA